MRKIVTLNENSDAIKHLISVDDQFFTLYRLIGEMPLRLSNDPYAFIVETIIGQMLSNKVSDIFIARLLELCGGKIDALSVGQLSCAKLRTIGISNRKAQYILDFTKNYHPSDYSCKKMSALSDDAIIKKLTSIKGLGMWTAKMFLLFVLGREDILPYEDKAFLQAFAWYNGLESFPKTDEIKSMCQKWSPYTSIAARYLYRALDKGLTKNPFGSYFSH